MKTAKNVVDCMQRDALYAYLELCNATEQIPEKGVYDNIISIEDGGALDFLTSFIEKEHGKYEKEKREITQIKEKSIFQRFLNLFDI